MQASDESGAEAPRYESRIAMAYVCPACNWCCMRTDGLKLNFGLEFDGTYCLRCWAKWVSGHIPRMNPIESPGRAPEPTSTEP